MPDEVLVDMGAVNVMVMQVSCKTPDCVPLETAIVIIFPSSKSESMEGLPESAGGSFQIVWMPLAADAATKDVVLDALFLAPGFSRRPETIERLCLQAAREVMVGQITQLFADEDVKARKLMAQYLQQRSLQDYMDADCRPPEWGEALSKDRNSVSLKETESANGDFPAASKFQTGEGNIVLQRPVLLETAEEEGQHHHGSGPTAALPPPQESRLTLLSSSSSSRPKPSVNSIPLIRQQHTARRQLAAGEHSAAGSLLSQLAERKHAPAGILRPGCPCCEPDNPSNAADRFLGF